MALELQTSEQLKKEMRSLPVQLSHGAFSEPLMTLESVDSAATTPAGLDEGQGSSGL
jgi:hypothetical protein